MKNKRITIIKDVKTEIINFSTKEILQKKKKKKKKKLEQWKRYAENRKNEDKISLTNKGKKHNLQPNCKSSQIEKSQDKITNSNTQIDNNKCLQKKDIVKKKKTQKRCAEKRKNEDRICLNSNGKKYILGHNWKSSQSQKSEDKSAYDSSKKCLRKRDVAKKKERKPEKVC